MVPAQYICCPPAVPVRSDPGRVCADQESPAVCVVESDEEMVFVGQQIESDQTGEIGISRTNVVIRINHGRRSRWATSRAGYLDGRSFAE